MEDKTADGAYYYEKQLEQFFAERLQFIAENKYPAQLSTDPPLRFVLHFVPRYFHEIYLDPRNFERPENYLLPLGEPPESILPDYNFDGLIFFSSMHEKHSYTQLFRDGRVEMVAAIAEGMTSERVNYLPIAKLKKNLFFTLSNNFAVLSRFDLPEPFYLYFRLLSVENSRLDLKDVAACGYDSKGRNKALVRNDLIFPRYRIDNFDVNLKAALHPFYDMLWNTFGFPGCPEID